MITEANGKGILYMHLSHLIVKPDCISLHKESIIGGTCHEVLHQHTWLKEKVTDCLKWLTLRNIVNTNFCCHLCRLNLKNLNQLIEVKLC